MKLGIAAFVVAGLTCVFAVSGQDSEKSKPEHILLTADDIKWADGPPSLPPGAQAAVMDGDPGKDGIFCLRLRFPAGYVIAPHWHPGNERVTVISGTFHIGLGEQFDESKCKVLPAGSYFSFPPQSPHFAHVEEETVVQLNSIGPWSLTYVNPKDDPRKKK